MEPKLYHISVVHRTGLITDWEHCLFDVPPTDAEAFNIYFTQDGKIRFLLLAAGDTLTVEEE